MTFRTHKQFGIAFAYITLMILYQFKLFEINYYLCFPIVLLINQWGAKFPDLDHEFCNVKDKNVLTWTINKIIHLTGGKHRSWQTHSWDVMVVYAVASTYVGYKIFNSLNFGLFALINLAFVSGWTSHLWSDSLTSAGTKIFCWAKLKLVFVPKKIGKFRFNTGGEWEDFNYKLMRKFDVVLGLVALVFPQMPTIIRISKQLITMIT